MAKEISGFIKLQIKGGQANPAPPVGPALGQRGVNIMEFCKAFNDKTKSMAGKPVPVEITVYKDKKFDFKIKSPPASFYIKEAVKLKGGSKEPGRNIVASISKKQLEDIGYTIQSFVEEKGFSVVRDFCGHGISTTFHESPNILHYGSKNTGMVLRPGMTFTIEPMINSGKYDVKMLNDGWTAVTKDKSLSAQFEHTLGITENGYEIFTESAKGYSKPPYL